MGYFPMKTVFFKFSYTVFFKRNSFQTKPYKKITKNLIKIMGIPFGY